VDNRERIADPQETLLMAFDSQLANLWTALPCIVSAVSFSANTISAQPAIKGTTTNPDGSTQSVNLPLLVDVPMVFPTAGGYSITFPVAIGDECLVVFASRCIDGWWQSGGIQEAMEFRMHDLSDGFAIIGTRSQSRTVTSWDTANLQIRSDDHSTLIEVDKMGKVNITAPTSMTLTTPLATFTGDVNVAGTLTATTDVIGGGKSLKNHTHTQGVDSSGDTQQNTGAPV